MMNVSTYWDIEKMRGELIIHKKNNKIFSFVSPESNIKDFNKWAEEAVKYLEYGGM